MCLLHILERNYECVYCWGEGEGLHESDQEDSSLIMGNLCGGKMPDGDGGGSSSNGGYQIFPLDDRAHFRTPRIPYCAISPTINSVYRKVVGNSSRFDDQVASLQPVLYSLHHKDSQKLVPTHEELEKIMVSMGWKARAPRHGWRSYCLYRDGYFGPNWVVARLPYPNFVDSRPDFLDEFIADVKSACGTSCFSLRKDSGAVPAEGTA